MKQLINKAKVLILVVLSLALIGVVAAPRVFADAKSAVCEGAGLTVGSSGSGCAAPAGSPDVDSALAKGMNLFSAILGIIAVVMIMVGGLKYMTSQGDAGQMNSAKNTIIFAAIGLLIVALAQVIVNFVLERFTRADPAPTTTIVEFIQAFMV